MGKLNTWAKTIQPTDIRDLSACDRFLSAEPEMDTIYDDVIAWR